MSLSTDLHKVKFLLCNNEAEQAMRNELYHWLSVRKVLKIHEAIMEIEQNIALDIGIIYRKYTQQEFEAWYKRHRLL